MLFCFLLSKAICFMNLFFPDVVGEINYKFTNITLLPVLCLNFLIKICLETFLFTSNQFQNRFHFVLLESVTFS